MIHELIEKLDPSPVSRSAFPRCQHRSPAGRQCSQPICSTSPEFCFTHKPKPEDLLIAELTEAAGALSNPEDIHRFLTRVTLLRIQGRITPRECSSYAYLCLILQRGQREIAFHQKLREERAERQADQARSITSLSSLWSISRPDRSDPSDPPTRDLSAPATSTAAESTDVPQPSFVGAGLARPSSTATPSPSPSVEDAPSARHPDRSSEAFPLRSGGTVATNSAQAQVDGITTPSAEKSPADKSNRPEKSAAPKPSESFTSSMSSTSFTSPLPPDFHNHFSPIDLTLPPGSQDLSKNIPHPDAAECARRNARRGLDFSRRKSSSRFFQFWR